jgi:pimeloyl-ACP methyl ester carboxylesterase
MRIGHERNLLMMDMLPFVRATGSGPTVICLHASGASSRQWEPLMTRLASRYRILAVDLDGHGNRPKRPDGIRATLEREAALVAPLVLAAEREVHLVGHSYGAAVAVALALAHPDRVGSLTIYEPVMFRLLFDDDEAHPAAKEIGNVVIDMRWHIAAGHPLQAARRFVDYWSGAGTWDAFDASQQQAIAKRVPAIMDCFDAVFADTTQLEDLQCLDIPVLSLRGASTRASAFRVGLRLESLLPNVTLREFAGLGHMGPVSHPDVVNRVIEAFLNEHRLARHTQPSASVEMRSMKQPLLTHVAGELLDASQS